MKKSVYSVIILFIMSACALCSCDKTENVYDFKFSTPPPPATENDTVISVLASLNGSDYKALGRALQPDSLISISFFEVNTEAYLDIVLGSDTPGVYSMGRSISTSTAVYFLNREDKLAKKGFTSRATDSAGGYVKIDSINKASHRLKGTFELRLRSRTDTNKFDFKSGTFDIPYNYATLELDAQKVTAVSLLSGLEGGSAAAPAPFVVVHLPDSMELRIEITSYLGITQYKYENNNLIARLTDKKHSIIYEPVTGSMNLIRFNYREFMQAQFEMELRANDGQTKRITNGTLVLGNFY